MKVYALTYEQWLGVPKIINIKGTQKDRQDTLYIGRNLCMGGWKLKKSKWHNPYPVKQYGLEESLRLFEIHLRENLLQDIHELKGQVLGCWCKPNDCHGDLLRTYYIRSVGRLVLDTD